MWRVCEIREGFAFEHEINNSNAEVSTFYWIVDVYALEILVWCICYQKSFNIFGNAFNTKLSKYATLLPFAYKAIHCILIDLHSSTLFLWIKAFESRFILKISLHLEVNQRIRQDQKSFFHSIVRLLHHQQGLLFCLTIHFLGQ